MTIFNMIKLFVTISFVTVQDSFALNLRTEPAIVEPVCTLPTIQKAIEKPREYVCRETNLRPKVQIQLAELVEDTTMHKIQGYDARQFGNMYVALTFPWGTITISALTWDLFAIKDNAKQKFFAEANAGYKISTDPPNAEKHEKDKPYFQSHLEVIKAAFEDPLPRGGQNSKVTIHAPEVVKKVLMQHEKIYEKARKENTTPAHILQERLETAINQSEWKEGFTLFDLYAFLVLTQESGNNARNGNVSTGHFHGENEGAEMGNEFQDNLQLAMETRFKGIEVIHEAHHHGHSINKIVRAQAGITALDGLAIGFATDVVFSKMEGLARSKLKNQVYKFKKKLNLAEIKFNQQLQDALNTGKLKQDIEKEIEKIEALKQKEIEALKHKEHTAHTKEFYGGLAVTGATAAAKSAILAVVATAVANAFGESIAIFLPQVVAATKVGALAGAAGSPVGVIVGAAAGAAVAIVTSVIFHNLMKLSWFRHCVEWVVTQKRKMTAYLYDRKIDTRVWLHENYLTGLREIYTKERALAWEKPLDIHGADKMYVHDSSTCQIEGCKCKWSMGRRLFKKRHTCRRCNKTVCGEHFKKDIANAFGSADQLVQNHGMSGGLCSACQHDLVARAHELVKKLANKIKTDVPVVEPVVAPVPPVQEEIVTPVPELVDDNEDARSEASTVDQHKLDQNETQVDKTQVDKPKLDQNEAKVEPKLDQNEQKVMNIQKPTIAKNVDINYDYNNNNNNNKNLNRSASDSELFKKQTGTTTKKAIGTHAYRNSSIPQRPIVQPN